MTNQECGCCGCVGQEETKGRMGGLPIVGLPDGWVTFETTSELVVDIPWEGDFLLPIEVVDAIRVFAESYPGGLVRCDRLGPEVTVADVREVVSHFAGVVCPDCLAKHEDWDNFEWLRFLSRREEGNQ